MGAFFVPVVGLVIVLVLGGLVVRRASRRELDRSDRLQRPGRPTVRYRIPPGQDPAAVIAELRSAGFDASADSEPGPSSPVIIIGTANGSHPDRDQLRDLLAGAPVNIDPAVDSETELAASRVQFLDE
jgi:hypothetical protein